MEKGLDAVCPAGRSYRRVYLSLTQERPLWWLASLENDGMGCLENPPRFSKECCKRNPLPTVDGMQMEAAASEAPSCPRKPGQGAEAPF